MNRIVLIGNGFDLAHGLKTSYRDFANNYWKEFALNFTHYRIFPFEDELIKFEWENGADFYCTRGMSPDNFFVKARTIESYEDLKRLIAGANERNDEQLVLTFKSRFFEVINQKLSTQQWVDIENEYYRLLKKILDKHYKSESVDEITEEFKKELKKLNDDLGVVKDKLTKYLKKSQGETIVNKDIRNIIYQPFDPRDVSNEGQGKFSEFLTDRYAAFKNHTISKSFMQMYSSYIDWVGQHYIEDYISKNTDVDTYVNNIKSLSKRDDESSFFLLPDNILVLTFNYTKTAGLYKGDGGAFQLNHIHGELDNEKNPVIFGYGDEMDEQYKKIADFNDNEYLKNIKSIRYLETANYRNLLTFADSAPYQIYIMGHSCGNSDRTLLNTIFEHKNCLSIKPFFHRKEDGTDDYINIVQNISRNFKNATLMRDRVVNKTYCKPLPQNESV